MKKLTLLFVLLAGIVWKGEAQHFIASFGVQHSWGVPRYVSNSIHSHYRGYDWVHTKRVQRHGHFYFDVVLQRGDVFVSLNIDDHGHISRRASYNYYPFQNHVCGHSCGYHASFYNSYYNRCSSHHHRGHNHVTYARTRYYRNRGHSHYSRNQGNRNNNQGRHYSNRNPGQSSHKHNNNRSRGNNNQSNGRNNNNGKKSNQKNNSGNKNKSSRQYYASRK